MRTTYTSSPLTSQPQVWSPPLSIRIKTTTKPNSLVMTADYFWQGRVFLALLGFWSPGMWLLNTDCRYRTSSTIQWPELLNTPEECTKFLSLCWIAVGVLELRSLLTLFLLVLEPSPGQPALLLSVHSPPSRSWAANRIRSHISTISVGENSRQLSEDSIKTISRIVG